jgi:hypothetical protein
MMGVEARTMRTATVALTLALAGCRGVACTEIGCSGSLDLTFHGGTYDDGTYSVTVTIADQTTGCTFNLPGGNCGQTVAFVDGEDLFVALPTGMVGTPPEIGVKLVRNATEVVTDTTVQVDWGDVYYPNGEQCDPEGCASGAVTVPVG